jgi:hypothetical protein
VNPVIAVIAGGNAQVPISAARPERFVFIGYGRQGEFHDRGFPKRVKTLRLTTDNSLNASER